MVEKLPQAKHEQYAYTGFSKQRTATSFKPSKTLDGDSCKENNYFYEPVSGSRPAKAQKHNKGKAAFGQTSNFNHNAPLKSVHTWQSSIDKAIEGSLKQCKVFTQRLQNPTISRKVQTGARREEVEKLLAQGLSKANLRKSLNDQAPIGSLYVDEMTSEGAHYRTFDAPQYVSSADQAHRDWSWQPDQVTVDIPKEIVTQEARDIQCLKQSTSFDQNQTQTLQSKREDHFSDDQSQPVEKKPGNPDKEKKTDEAELPTEALVDGDYNLKFDSQGNCSRRTRGAQATSRQAMQPSSVRSSHSLTTTGAHQKNGPRSVNLMHNAPTSLISSQRRDETTGKRADSLNNRDILNAMHGVSHIIGTGAQTPNPQRSGIKQGVFSSTYSQGGGVTRIVKGSSSTDVTRQLMANNNDFFQTQQQRGQGALGTHRRHISTTLNFKSSTSVTGQQPLVPGDYNTELVSRRESNIGTKETSNGGLPHFSATQRTEIANRTSFYNPKLAGQHAPPSDFIAAQEATLLAMNKFDVKVISQGHLPQRISSDSGNLLSRTCRPSIELSAAASPQTNAQRGAAFNASILNSPAFHKVVIQRTDLIEQNGQQPALQQASKIDTPYRPERPGLVTPVALTQATPTAKSQPKTKTVLIKRQYEQGKYPSSDAVADISQNFHAQLMQKSVYGRTMTSKDELQKFEMLSGLTSSSGGVASTTPQTQQHVQMKLFEGLSQALQGRGSGNRAVYESQADSKSKLKGSVQGNQKSTVANHVRKVTSYCKVNTGSGAPPAYRTSSHSAEKSSKMVPQLQTFVDKQSAKLGDPYSQLQSLDSAAATSAGLALMQQSSSNWEEMASGHPQQTLAYLRSLEVLEERSNEDNSPQIKRKKGGLAKGANYGREGGHALLHRCSSSPENLSPNQNRHNATVSHFKEINLSNQRLILVPTKKSNEGTNSQLLLFKQLQVCQEESVTTVDESPLETEIKRQASLLNTGLLSEVVDAIAEQVAISTFLPLDQRRIKRRMGHSRERKQRLSFLLKLKSQCELMRMYCALASRLQQLMKRSGSDSLKQQQPSKAACQEKENNKTTTITHAATPTTPHKANQEPFRALVDNHPTDPQTNQEAPIESGAAPQEQTLGKQDASTSELRDKQQTQTQQGTPKKMHHHAPHHQTHQQSPWKQTSQHHFQNEVAANPDSHQNGGLIHTYQPQVQQPFRGLITNGQNQQQMHQQQMQQQQMAPKQQVGDPGAQQQQALQNPSRSQKLTSAKKLHGGRPEGGQQTNLLASPHQNQKAMKVQQQQFQQAAHPLQQQRPGSNHRVLVPIKQLPPQHSHQSQNVQSPLLVHQGGRPDQQHQHQHQMAQTQQIQQRSGQVQVQAQPQQKSLDSQSQASSSLRTQEATTMRSLQSARKPSETSTANTQGGADSSGNQVQSTTPAQAAESTGAGQRQATSTPIKQPRTYKEIRQRLHQQQQMQYLRQQQQQWIQRQQQILLANNPGATLEQVNAIIQQSIINQQQQMAMKQQQAQIQALQQMSASLAQSTAQAASASQHPQGGAGGPQGHHQVTEATQIFPAGSMSAGAAQGQQPGSTDRPDEDQEQAKSTKVVQKRHTAALVGSAAANASQQQVQIKQNINGQVVSIGMANASQSGQPSQNAPSTSNGGNHKSNAQNHGTSASTKGGAASQSNSNQARDETLMSYAQLLKQECQYDGGPSAQVLNYKPSTNNASLQPTNLPAENLKHTLQQLTSEILRKVLARSDSMNQLRQIIDLKAKKVKPKNYESSIFSQIMDKEQQRVTQESQALSKNVLRVEDKTLIKYLRGQVKKMLKPFRGLQYDDFLNNEIHLNEIMATQDQQNDPIKESRKRHLRILDAALKETVVDIHIVLGICVQISRQAFYNELQEYFACAYEYIMANQGSFQPHDIQGIVNLKKRLGSVRSHSKVQIQTTKKLDRMFWLLLEQNQEVRNNIRTYKERYNEKTADMMGLSHQMLTVGGDGSQLQGSSGNGGNHLNSANHLHRRHTNTLRSSSGIGTASPKVSAGGSSHNIFNAGTSAQKGGAGGASGQESTSVRRTVTKGARSSNFQQETYDRSGNGRGQNQGNGGGNGGNKASLSQSHDERDPGASLHATAGKAHHLLSKAGAAGKGSQLAPLANGQSKKAQSLIQKKMKARDLDRQLSNQHNNAVPASEKTPEQASIARKRMSSTKQNQLQSASQHQATAAAAATPQNFHPRSRTKHLNVINSNSLYQGGGAPGQSTASERQPNGQSGSSNANNSTENLFNLIQATKTKNTMILEPLAKRHQQTDSLQGGVAGAAQRASQLGSRDDIGSGLQAQNNDSEGGAAMSQKSHNRMRKTDYSRGFMSNYEIENANGEIEPSQVLILNSNNRAGGRGAEGKIKVKHHRLAQDEPPSPSKVFRSWSRPQIVASGQPSDLQNDPNNNWQVISTSNLQLSARQDLAGKLQGVGPAGKVLKTMQVCTCARYRKRIDFPSGSLPGGINVAELGNASGVKNKTSSKFNQAMEVRSNQDGSEDARSAAAESDMARRKGPSSLSMQGEHVQDLNGLKAARKQQSQDEINTPRSRQNQPRMSQDFKMRILTKKKVAVPPSAASQSRQHYNQTATHHGVGGASQSSLERRKRLIPSHSGSGGAHEEDTHHVGNQSEQRHPRQPIHDLTGVKNQSVLQKSKIVTYELCQECGGQRPAGLPQVTSSLSEIKVKLKVSKVSSYHSGSGDEDGFPGTARLNDSKRSSTLSLGDRDELRRRSSRSATGRSRGDSGTQFKPGQPGYKIKYNQTDQNQNNFLSSAIQLHKVKSHNTVTAERLNVRYLTVLGATYYPGLQEFIIIVRARRIQAAYKARFARRSAAARFIQKRWRLHRKSKDQVLLRMAKQQHLRKKVAINRIYDLSRLIKVRKVTASAQLVQHHLWQLVAQSQEALGQTYLDQIVRIQRKWRAVLSQRYLVGKALVAKKATREKIWEGVMQRKYCRLQALESAHVFQEAMFAREQKNLEAYFYKQQVNYAKDLETRGAKIEQRLNADFALADWNFDQMTREWTNSSKSMTIKLERNEASQVTVLRDKLVQFYVKNQLPSEDAINKQLDEFVEARNAMQKALKKEQDYKKRHTLQRIKRQRTFNLFTAPPGGHLYSSAAGGPTSTERNNSIE